MAKHPLGTHLCSEVSGHVKAKCSGERPIIDILEMPGEGLEGSVSLSPGRDGFEGTLLLSV